MYRSVVKKCQRIQHITAFANRKLLYCAIFVVWKWCTKRIYYKPNWEKGKNWHSHKNGWQNWGELCGFTESMCRWCDTFTSNTNDDGSIQCIFMNFTFLICHNFNSKPILGWPTNTAIIMTGLLIECCINWSETMKRMLSFFRRRQKQHSQKSSELFWWDFDWFHRIPCWTITGDAF